MRERAPFHLCPGLLGRALEDCAVVYGLAAARILSEKAPGTRSTAAQPHRFR